MLKKGVCGPSPGGSRRGVLAVITLLPQSPFLHPTLSQQGKSIESSFTLRFMQSTHSWCSSAHTLRTPRLACGREPRTQGPAVIRHPCRHGWRARLPSRTNCPVAYARRPRPRLPPTPGRSGDRVAGLDAAAALPQTRTVVTAAGTADAPRGPRPAATSEAPVRPRPCDACSPGASGVRRPRTRAPVAAARRVVVLAWSANTGRIVTVNTSSLDKNQE